MLGLGRQQHFHKHIGDHVGSWTVDQLNVTVSHDPAYEMESNIDMLGMRVVLVVFCECDG